MKIGRKFFRMAFNVLAVLGIISLLTVIYPSENQSEGKLPGISLVKPAFAQQSSTFPSDEAGISAYVNVEQSIDLSKAKASFRGIQAEGDNYVIGIMELPGNPEEEFPHVYISSDGWILAYYSKFAPTSRIFQWYGYQGHVVSTTTLQDAISKICSRIGVSFVQVRESMGYYHFKYSDATKLVIAVETIEIEGGDDSDTFQYSIPHDVTFYEGSYSHFSQISQDTLYPLQFTTTATIDDARVSGFNGSGLTCDVIEEPELTPGRAHRVQLVLTDPGWAGVATVFIYR